MSEPPSAHGFRRTLAWGAIGFWFLLGLVPMIGLLIQTVRGDRTGSELAIALVVFGIPAALFTVGLYYAVQIYRAKSPADSRSPAWKLGAAFLAGFVVFLGASAVFLR
ncbi:hypothetical protein AB0B66_18825 [Catellatospora sp. NPDC049111]|uniref:hypothetical protein n=1 Tax=Catellatospora sp. NPDC049111 TaxID=3155271 RepID=UPI0033C13344